MLTTAVRSFLKVIEKNLQMISLAVVYPPGISIIVHLFRGNCKKTINNDSALTKSLSKQVLLPQLSVCQNYRKKWTIKFQSSQEDIQAGIKVFYFAFQFSPCSLRCST